MASNPFVRIVVPFALGIQLSLLSHWPAFAGEVTVFLACGLLLPALYIHYYGAWHRRFWIAPLVLLVYFFMGFSISQSKKANSQHDYFGHYSGQTIFAEVAEPVEPRSHVDRAMVEVLAVADTVTGSFRPAGGKMLVYLRHAPDNKRWIPGARVVMDVRRDSIPPALNPGQFNYRKYMGFHGVNYQAFVNRDDWRFYSMETNWHTWLYRVQVFLRHRLDQHDFSKDTQAVLAALLLGQRQFIADDLRRAYASAGAMHVLAVSGLHVGIIFLLINALTARMRRVPKLRTPSLLITLVTLWLYAAVTGLSPSVLRAATMFSFIALATHNNKHGSIYNNLAASAFLLLAISPNLLVEVGFQLSYLAVLGIVFLQPKIYWMVLPKNWLFDKVWALTAVSISAQVAVFPLGLLYFHQFPNYFLLSNLLVIPSAVVILYSGLLLLIVSNTLVGDFLAWWLEHFVSGMNEILRWIEARPFSLTHEISFSIPETVLIYAGIIALLTFIIRPTKFRFWLASGLIIALFTWQVVEEVKLDKQRNVLVYAVRDETAIDVIQGKRQDFVTSKRLFNDESQMLFNVKNAWYERDLEEPHWIPISKKTSPGQHSLWKKPYWLFGQRKLYILTKAGYDKAQKIPAGIDWIVLHNSPAVNLPDLAEKVNGCIIADGSNKYYVRRKWRQVADSLKLPFWDCMERGSFEASW